MLWGFSWCSYKSSYSYVFLDIGQTKYSSLSGLLSMLQGFHECFYKTSNFETSQNSNSFSESLLMLLLSLLSYNISTCVREIANINYWVANTTQSMHFKNTFSWSSPLLWPLYIYWQLLSTLYNTFLMSKIWYNKSLRK